MRDRILESLGGDAPPEGLSAPEQALWWLKKGGLVMGPEWERAHEICQAGEGQRGQDLVHGLVHWIEGDPGNAAYWYRRAGEARGADIASDWERIAGLVGE